MSDAIVQALREADAFHRNVALMFDDFWNAILQQTLNEETALLAKEGAYGVWGPDNSDHRRLLVFRNRDRIRFAQALVKVPQERLRVRAQQYRRICARLGISPEFPLIFAWGIFRPSDEANLQPSIGQWRNWCDNALLINVPDDKNFADPAAYEWNATVTLENNDPSPWYCQGASIRLRHLMDIRSADDLAAIAADLLSL